MRSGWCWRGSGVGVGGRSYGDRVAIDGDLGEGLSGAAFVGVVAKAGVDGVGFAEVVAGVAEALLLGGVGVEGAFAEDAGDVAGAQDAEAGAVHELIGE